MKAEDHTSTVVEKPDDASSLQPDPDNSHSLKGKLSRFARRLSAQHDSSSPSSTSQKKEMESEQRRIEAIANYERSLQERIDDREATEEERQEAAQEKRFYESHDKEWQENWVVSKMTLQSGWGAGVYGEGVNPPGMWYK